MKKIITVYTNSIIGSIEHWIQRVDNTKLLYESSDLGIIEWSDRNILLRFVFWPIDEEDEEEEQTLWERIKEKLSINTEETTSKNTLPSFLPEENDNDSDSNMDLNDLSDLDGSPIINLFTFDSDKNSEVEVETIEYISDTTVEDFHKRYNSKNNDNNKNNNNHKSNPDNDPDDPKVA